MLTSLLIDSNSHFFKVGQIIGRFFYYTAFSFIVNLGGVCLVLSITFSNGKYVSFEVQRVCTSYVKNAVSFQPSLYYETLSHERGKGIDIPMGNIIFFEVRLNDC